MTRTHNNDRNMLPADGQFRLAVSVFYAFEQLWAAMCAIASDGVAASQFHLVGLLESMRGCENYAVSTSVTEPNPSAIFQRLEYLPHKVTAPAIVATSGPVHSSLLHAEFFTSVDDRQDRMPVSHKQEIEAHILDSAIALYVHSIDAAQQRQVARRLLAKSSYPVRIYEFSLAQQDHARRQN